MQVEGTIIQVSEPVTGSTKKGGTWAKQDFVIETGGQYKKNIALSLWGDDKIQKYDLEKGLKITAHLDIESREHNGRWYTDIKAWKIEWDENQRRWKP